MTLKTRLNKLESKKQLDNYSLSINFGYGEILHLGNFNHKDIEELNTVISQGDNVLTRLQDENK